MNNLDYKKPSIFNFYFFVGLSLLISAWIEILLNDYLLSRLSLPLTLMTLIYWNVATPRNIGFLWTMISGFVLDIFLGYLLGTHVLIFLLASYFSQRYFHRFRALFRLQQSLIVAMIVFIYQTIFISISSFDQTFYQLTQYRGSKIFFREIAINRSIRFVYPDFSEMLKNKI